MFINLNMAYLFLFLFFLSNIQLVYHQQTPGLRKYLMQCLISQKQRINEVQMFCQIIFPRELVKEPSHPIKLLCVNYCRTNVKFYCSLQMSLKWPLTPELLSILFPIVSLKTHKKLAVCLCILFIIMTGMKPCVQGHCASVRLIVGGFLNTEGPSGHGGSCFKAQLIHIPITPHSFPKEVFYLITELGSFQGPNRTAF